MKQSAGILLYRRSGTSIEVFLVHPGGPFWAKKDSGAWSIPKGEYAEGEEALDAAKREFTEETGFVVDGVFTTLTPLKQPSGKVVSAWAIESNVDRTKLRSNLFSMEWPPKSRRQQTFPEVDRGEWFSLQEARKKLLPGQAAFLDEIAALLQRQ